jgi:hypothetical protein
MYHALVASGAENIDIMFMILSAADCRRYYCERRRRVKIVK